MMPIMAQVRAIASTKSHTFVKSPHAQFRAMTKTTGRQDVRRVLATNVRRLIDHSGHSDPEAARQVGMKPFQLQRITRAEHAVTITTLQKLANGYGVEPYQLLVPNLNPKDPQVLRVLSPEEERLYKALEAARQTPHR